MAVPPFESRSFDSNRIEGSDQRELEPIGNVLIFFQGGSRHFYY